ncbi:MAG: conjugal transfer protein TraB [Euryarchaeota archaeon]|nr:conjugal transfer protein TraB [Euryarchaeota archaeon]
MIVIVGTGHVFNISESVSFIVKNLWPEVLMVELDAKRYAALTDERQTSEIHASSSAPRSYMRSARYQERISKEHGTEAGGEFLAAIHTANALDARIVCIDRDAEEVMAEMEAEMKLTERLRYRLSAYTDGLLGKRRVEKVQRDFAVDEDAYMHSMRRRYPTLVRKLIDERDAYMAERIRENLPAEGNTVVIVGDAHVEGLLGLLSDLEPCRIRLSDLLDPFRLNRVKDAVWNDELGNGDWN